MRRMVVWCATVGLALAGCDNASSGLGGALSDGGNGTGDTTGVGADVSGAGDTGGESDDVAVSTDAPQYDAGTVDAGPTPADTATPDVAVDDVATHADAVDDTGAPVDAVTPSDTGGPQDTVHGDSTTPDDTATPKDAGPEDTGPPPTDPSGLRITEVMYDPTAVPDEGGEWIELLNTSAEAVDLVGLSISDSVTPHLIVSAAPLMVQPGAYAVLARSGDPAKTGGFTPLYVFADFSLTNTGDSVVLRAGTTEIDRVDYNEAAGWPDAMGFSIQLDPTLDPKGEHNAVTDWCAASTPFGPGDLGSPGVANPACGVAPDPGDPSGLVITEIMYDPTAVSDADGEWVELLNTGAKQVDLRGVTFADSGTSTVIDDAKPLWVPAGGRALLGRNKDVAQNGGLTVLWSYSFGLNNDKDSVILSKGGVEIDRVDYDEGAGWPAAVGASIQLDGDKDPATTNNAIAAAWCVSTAASVSGDLGTPGAANTACGSAPVGPCVGNCGAENVDAGCWCDDACVSTGDCCSDACETCGYCGGGADSCVGACGGAGGATCWCDDLCVGNGDCCPDACSACGFCP